MMGAILDHLWQSTLLALGVGLLALAFRKAGAAVRYGLWFTASAKFLVPFAVLEALGGWLAPAARLPVEAAPEAVFIARAAQPFSPSHATAPEAHAAASVAHAAPGFDPGLILLAAWALGCAAVLIFWARRWARVRSAVRGAAPLAWSAPMPVLASPSLLEPGLVGLWRPVLIVPKTLPDHLAQPEIDAIVAHESCHLRRGDNLTAAIHMLVEALFWFHPLVWWIGARLIDERERACDEAVVRSGHDRAAYARGLLECCRLYLQSPLSCVAGAAGSNLKTRVEMIMTAPLSSPLPRSGKGLLLAAGVCAIASPVAAGLLAAPARQQAAARVSAIAPEAAAPATAIVSGSAPAPTDDAALTPVATSAPANAGTARTMAPARTPSEPAAETGTAPASSAQDVAEQAQPAPQTAAIAAVPAAAPTLAAALEPPIGARVATQTPGRGKDDSVPGQLASAETRQTSTQVTSRGQWQAARDPLGPGPYLQVSGMMKGGDWGGWSPWYAITTPPIAAGHSIRNLRYALRGDRRCGARPREDVRAECKITTDAPDKKTVMFRVLGERCDATGGDFDSGGYLGGPAAINPYPSGGSYFGNPNPQGGSSRPRFFAPAAMVCPRVQAEMVISYDVE